MAMMERDQNEKEAAERVAAIPSGLDDRSHNWCPCGKFLIGTPHDCPPNGPLKDRQLTPEEWQQGVELAVCFISGCDYLDIDPRGPVFLRDDPKPHYSCTEHWEAIIGIVGRQCGSNDEHAMMFGAR